MNIADSSCGKNCIRGAYSLDHWVVHVSDEPIVHRQVPKSPVLAQVSAIPPFLDSSRAYLVELSVSEHRKLSQDIQEELEEGKEADDPAGSVGQG